MKNVTITFTAPEAPVAQPVDQICSVFLPTNAAADNAAFDGTYYDTNVYGWTVAETLEQFMKDSVAHPGLIAALRKAIADGTYTFEADEKEALYIGEVAPALADQGFTFEVE